MKFYNRRLKKGKNCYKTNICKLTISGSERNKVIQVFLFSWVLFLVFLHYSYAQVILKTNRSLVFLDSEELVGENGVGVNAFDGKTNTFWHTKWFGSKDPSPPHEIQINVESKYNVSGIRYLPRRDGEINGQIKQEEYYVSTDGTNGILLLDKPASDSVIKKTKKVKPQAKIRNRSPNGVIDTPSGNVTINAGGSMNFTGTGTDPDNNTPLTFLWNFGGSGIPNSTIEDPGTKTFNTAGTFTVSFTVTDARGLADPSPGTRAVSVVANQPPNGAIDTPSGDVTIDVGGSVNFMGTYTDPDNNFPLTCLWNFGAGSGISNSTVEDPGLKQFNTAGTFTVNFTVTDALGLADLTPDTRTVTVQATNQAPNGVIDTPSGNVTINAGGSVNFTGTGTDTDNNTPLTFQWNFGAGSGISNSTVEDTGLKQFNTAGTFTVSFTVTDALGLADPTPATRIITVQAPVIPKTNWSLVFVDSQELVGENGAGVNAFDGNVNTRWHTKWFGGSDPLPHEIQINLGAEYSVSGFRYRPNQVNGRIKQWEFYVSNSTTNWGTPVATGTFANDATEKEVLFTQITGQYIRLRALSEVNGNPWTHAAEITVLGISSGNQPPNGVIDTPSGNVTINVGSSVNFTGTGTDPDNNTPLTFLWNFGAGSGISNSTVEDTGLKQFNTAGTFTVSFTVTDALGLADPTPATRIITVQAPVIPKTNWSLVFVDSQELVGENGAGVNAFDGNTSTIWHTKWFGGSDPLPHEIQINLGGVYNVSGFRYRPNQVNGRINQWEFYVSNSTTNWGTPVATGTFANDATEKEILFTQTTGQYIRLRAPSEVNGNPWTHAAEINVLGVSSGNQAPNGVIDTPSGNVTINVGSSVNFTGTGTDPDNNLPLTFLWNFGAGSGISNSTVEDPGLKQFNTAGTFTVNFTVTDALVLADPTPATRTITVQTPNQSPNGVIDTPSGNITVNLGDSVNFTGTGTDPDNNLPLTFLWNFGAGSGISNSTFEDPGFKQFSTVGTFTVTFTVTDALGLADPTPATRTVTVQGGTIPDWTNVTYSPFNLVTPTSVTNPVLKASDVTGTTATFVADTFLFYENTTWYMFNEVLNTSTNHGDEGVSTSSDGLHWTYQQIVLNETFHLSYPYVFKFNDSYYMIPETYQRNEIRIYWATNFPYSWSYLATLVSGRDFIDSSIFRYNGKWWMFTSDTTTSNCYLYYSDNLTSGWVEHPMSPIVAGDASKARPGGRAFVYDTNRVIRTAQKGNVVYGEKVRVFEADTLTTTQYVEHEIPESPILSNSGSGWNATGMHQFDPWWTGNHWNCSVDGKNGSIWSAGIYLSPHPSSPNGVIDSPATNVTINEGQSVVFAGTGSDQDSNLPLSFRWQFGTGSGISDSTQEDPGSVQFNIPGTFTVTFTVTDALGIYDPTPGVRTISVLNTSTVIPKTNWSLRFVDSQELVGENGAAVNAFDGNTSTIWHTKWSGGSDPLPHEIQINLGAMYNVTGFRYLPRQDGDVNGRIKQWEFYVSTDGTNWGSAAATGTFVNDATEKEVSFTEKTGQYVRLRALSEVNNNPWTSMAEITVLQN